MRHGVSNEDMIAGRLERSKRDGLGGGPVPFGYRKGTSDAIEINQDAVPTIRTLIMLRETGLNYRETAETLTRLGYKTPAGTDAWTTGQVQRVERHKETYRTGKRIWGNVEAEQLWPTIV